MCTQKKYGLIGKRLDYSFSKNYFTLKFEVENVAHSYHNIELDDLENLKEIISQKEISGFNVTIPFKKKIIPLLDSLTKEAAKINAVNCVEITKDNKWIGHNTDVIGFKKSLLNLIKNERPNALIFGTGGASKAVQFVLNKLEINFQTVSRSENLNTFQYLHLDKQIIQNHKLLINTTPVGTFPNTENCLDIPFEFIGKNHYCFDLIYNPKKTTFLERAQDNGAAIKNGLEMLEIQAKESWKIWQTSSE